MERIRQKIGRLAEYLSLIEGIKDDCLTRFTEDRIYRGALLHYLYMMADSSITLAEMVIKHKKLRIPQSYQEAFDILGESGILAPKFAHSFAKIAGFRNFLAHDYESIDAKVICEETLKRLQDVRTFLDQIKNSLNMT